MKFKQAIFRFKDLTYKKESLKGKKMVNLEKLGSRVKMGDIQDGRHAILQFAFYKTYQLNQSFRYKVDFFTCFVKYVS